MDNAISDLLNMQCFILTFPTNLEVTTPKNVITNQELLFDFYPDCNELLGVQPCQVTLQPVGEQLDSTDPAHPRYGDFPLEQTVQVRSNFLLPCKFPLIFKIGYKVNVGETILTMGILVMLFFFKTFFKR